jgi:hypothetical protein
MKCNHFRSFRKDKLLVTFVTVHLAFSLIILPQTSLIEVFPFFNWNLFSYISPRVQFLTIEEVSRGEKEGDCYVVSCQRLQNRLTERGMDWRKTLSMSFEDLQRSLDKISGLESKGDQTIQIRLRERSLLGSQYNPHTRVESQGEVVREADFFWAR